MSTVHTEELDQKLYLRVELAKGHEPRPEIADEIRGEVVRSLSRLNPGYAKGHAMLGARAEPHIDLVKSGEMGNVPGRKHRWVKR